MAQKDNLLKNILRSLRVAGIIIATFLIPILIKACVKKLTG